MIAIGLLLAAESAFCQKELGPQKELEPEKPLETVRVVAVKHHPYSFPNEQGVATGSSVDVMDEIARRNGWKNEYTFVNSQEDAVAALINDLADAAVGGLTITLERSLMLDYGRIYEVISLQTLVRKDSLRGTSFLHVMGALTSPDMLMLFGTGIAASLIGGLVILVLERRAREKLFPPTLHDNVWWAGQTLVAHNCGAKIPTTHRGRFLAMFLMVGGTVFTAQMTALLSDSLANTFRHKAIEGPADFAGRVIGTVQDSEAQRFLVANLVSVRPYPSALEAVQALQAEEVAAVAYDEPVLKRILKEYDIKDLELVGPRFGQHPHSTLVQVDSPFLKGMNQAIRDMTSDRTLNAITEKWFGLDQLQTAGGRGVVETDP